MGDVWICGGQSNMELQVMYAKNAAKEIQRADYNEIREYKVQKEISGVEKDDFGQQGQWLPATSANVGNFSAVAYFFARTLYEHTHIPIGLIYDNWGATDVETWTSRKALLTDSLMAKVLKDAPPFSSDTLTRLQQSYNEKALKRLQIGVPYPEIVKHWKDIVYDDSKWPKIQLPGRWRDQSLGDVEGVVWFRKVIRLSSLSPYKATLMLPWVAQSDSTYVNGVLIGATTNKPQSSRIYTIPSGVLKQGDNLISIRISDSTNTGGISGDTSSMSILMRETSIPLTGLWSFQVEKTYNVPIWITPNVYPSLLYNAMIHPITKLAVKGIIWYQGEANVDRAHDYAKGFPLLINDWRQQFHQSDLPFLFVQISSFNWGNGNSNKGSLWGELREAQTKALSLKNTGMAVTVDIGETNNIHPQNKQDVGKRLAAIALNKVYGENMKYKGPSFSGMETKADSVVVKFTDAESGLVVNDKYQYLKGFEIAGADQVFHYATAVVENNKVVVYSKMVSKPLAVRYAWADDASDANLYNGDGFPAVPFRTDNWKNITVGVHYKILQP